MSEPIKLTPALLAEIKQRAESVLDYKASGTPSYNELVMLEMAFQEKATPAIVLAMIAKIEQPISMPKPICEHWLSDEFPGDYESYCCTDGIRIDHDCELWEFCGYCGGKVEIIDCPEEFKCDECN